MLQQFHNIAFEIKLAIASALGLGTFLADISGDYKGWEDLSLKVLLLIALVYIGRLYLQQQKDHKSEVADYRREIVDTWAAHKRDVEEREDKMNAALLAAREDMAILIGLTKEQTDHYKSVTRKLIEDRIAKPTLP